MTLYLYSESQLIVWSFMPPSTTVRVCLILLIPLSFFFPFSVQPFFSLFKMPPLSHLLQWERHGLSAQKSLPCLLKIQFPTDFPSNKTIFLYSYVSFYHLPTLWYLGKLVFSKKKKKKRFVTFVYSSQSPYLPHPQFERSSFTAFRVISNL